MGVYPFECIKVIKPFSFGDQDTQYFNAFENDVEVEFYFHSTDDKEKLFERVENKFSNVKFISDEKWIDKF